MFIEASGFVWHIEGRAVSFAKLNSVNACFCLNNLLHQKLWFLRLSGSVWHILQAGLFFEVSRRSLLHNILDSSQGRFLPWASKKRKSNLIEIKVRPEWLAFWQSTQWLGWKWVWPRWKIAHLKHRTAKRVELFYRATLFFTVHNSSERPSCLLILTFTYMYDIIVLFSPNTYLQKVCSEPAVRIMAIYTFF